MKGFTLVPSEVEVCRQKGADCCSSCWDVERRLSFGVPGATSGSQDLPGGRADALPSLLRFWLLKWQF